MRKRTLTLTLAALVIALCGFWATNVEAQASRYVCKTQAGPGICDEGPPYYWSENPCVQCDVSFCESAHIFDSWYKISYDQCEASHNQCRNRCCVEGLWCWESLDCQCDQIRNNCIVSIAKDHERDCKGALSQRKICKNNNNCAE